MRTYSYNWLGQTLAIGNGDNAMYRYTYDLNGTLKEFIDNMASRKTLYEQDSLGRPVRQRLLSLSGSHLGEVEYGYDDRNNVSHLAVNFGGHTHIARYLSKEVSGIEDSARYAAENLPTQYRYSSARYANYEYTTLNLPRRRTFTTDKPLINEYAYYASIRNDDGEELYQTTRLKTETINGVVYKYSYDLSGNITKIQKGTQSNLVDYRRYAYDELGQLEIEKLYNSSGAETKTIRYNYDKYGNITSRSVEKASGSTKTYAYTYGTDADAGWSKLLKSYDGKNINYDEIGNPVYYLGANLTWSNGRQLKRYVDDDVTVAYTYDDEGMRTSKTVNGDESTYLYLNGKLHGEVRDGHHIHYSYDSYGNLSVIKYYKNSTDYNIFYVMTNVFGDVISLHNSSGTMVVSYEYDAWGNVISMTDTTGIGIGTINPIRYRGYYFDEETGLYYLASRYYDPQVGRFINADGQLNQQEGMTGYNVFQYCGNNPVNRSDPTGEAWWIAAGAIVGGLIGGIAQVAVNLSTGEDWNSGVLGAVVGGAVAGAIVTATGGTALAATGSIWAAYAGAAACALTNETISYVPVVSEVNGQKHTKQMTKENVINSVASVMTDTAIEGTVSVATGYIAGKIIPINNGWIKPVRFSSSFAGKYAAKFQLQTAMQSLLDSGWDALIYDFQQRRPKPSVKLYYDDTTISARR